LTNKLFNYLLSTFRHQNIILLFATPYSDFIDSASQKLIHCHFEVIGHNQKTKKTNLRPKLLDYNSNMKKFYYHSLIVLKDKKKLKMSNWSVNKPTEQLIKDYELAKTNFTSGLNAKIMKQLEEMDKVQEPQIIDTRKPLTSIQQEVYDLSCGGMFGQKIAEKLELSGSYISAILTACRKKGYKIEKIPIPDVSIP